jgi:hypothetical protein
MDQQATATATPATTTIPMVATMPINSMENDRGLLPSRPWKLIDQKLHVELLHMLKLIDELFTSHEIPYWVCGGTLLGTLRHGGFIPHDDDIDLELFQHDMERVRTLCEQHPELTFTNRTRYYEKQFGKIFLHGRKELVIDLFWRDDPCPLEPEFLAHDEVFPIKRYAFHDIEVNGPSKPESYLRRCYGDDYLTHCKVWTHDWNKQFVHGFSKDKEVMRVDDYLELCKAAGFTHVKLSDYDSIVKETAATADPHQEQKQQKHDQQKRVEEEARVFAETEENMERGVLPVPISTPNEPMDDQHKEGSLVDTF